MKQTFSPPNRVPENHQFILLLSDIPSSLGAVKLIHGQDPHICVATTGEFPPFNGHGPEIFNAWLEYHLRSAWKKGIVVFWLNGTDAQPEAGWLENALEQTLAEYRRLVHSRNQARLAIGFGSGHWAGAFHKANPEFPLYDSLTGVCQAASDMLRHCYHDPRLAVSR